MERLNYSLLDRIFHHMALGLPAVAEASFDLEMGNVRPVRAECVDARHVFVTGLARAGTTLVMRTLHETGAFRSLTYRDMPFVLMPNTWRRMSSRFNKSEKAAERAHGDGVLVDFDSPEALEEVFWRVFAGDAYIRGDRLVPHEPDAELLDRFRDYVGLILAQEQEGAPRRYLSKNNNSVLRIRALNQAFPNALIVVPFREPLQQARSLMQQHERFRAMHAADGFSRKYMTWLVHHEFGSDHRPFVFHEAEKNGLAHANIDTLDYWLQVWSNTYRHVLANAPEDTFFLSYDQMTRAPQSVLARLWRAAGLDDGSALPVAGIRAAPTVTDAPRSEALAEALGIHAQLAARAGSPGT